MNTTFWVLFKHCDHIQTAFPVGKSFHFNSIGTSKLAIILRGSQPDFFYKSLLRNAIRLSRPSNFFDWFQGWIKDVKKLSLPNLDILLQTVKRTQKWRREEDDVNQRAFSRFCISNSPLTGKSHGIWKSKKKSPFTILRAKRATFTFECNQNAKNVISKQCETLRNSFHFSARHGDDKVGYIRIH